MVAEATARALPAGVFAMRLLHRIQVVGKEQPVAVYEVLGLCEGGLNATIRQNLKADEDEVLSASFSGSMISVSASARGTTKHSDSDHGSLDGRMSNDNIVDASDGSMYRQQTLSRRTQEVQQKQPTAKLLDEAYARGAGSRNTNNNNNNNNNSNGEAIPSAPSRAALSVVVSAAQLRNAERHQAALKHFINSRFAECVETLQAPATTTPGDATLSAEPLDTPMDTASEILLRQAEHELAHPSDGGPFRGVWRATEK
jgi:hypothetical protein